MTPDDRLWLMGRIATLAFIQICTIALITLVYIEVR